MTHFLKNLITGKTLYTYAVATALAISIVFLAWNVYVFVRPSSRVLPQRTISFTTDHPDDIYKNEILRFAVVADTHIGQYLNGRTYGNTNRLRRALAVSREHSAEFIVTLGDLTQHGDEKELKEVKRILDEGKIRYFTSPGNHDVFQNPNYYDKLFGPKFNTSTYTLLKKAPDAYAPLNPEANLIFLDMTQMQSEYGDTLGSAQTQWLKNVFADTAQSANKITLVFAGGDIQTLESSEEDKVMLFLCNSHIVSFIYGGPHIFTTQEHSCLSDWIDKIPSKTFSFTSISPGTIGEFSPQRSAQVTIIHVFPDFRFEIERIPIGVNPIYPDFLNETN